MGIQQRALSQKPFDDWLRCLVRRILDSFRMQKLLTDIDIKSIANQPTQAIMHLTNHTTMRRALLLLPFVHAQALSTPPTRLRQRPRWLPHPSPTN